MNWMSSRGKENLLFCGGDLGESLRQHFTRAAQAVDNIPRDDFVALPDEEITRQVLKEFYPA